MKCCRNYIVCLSLILGCRFLWSEGDLSDIPLMFDQGMRQPELFIQNQILAQIGDKTISVIDVVKKMDAVLQKYPSHFKSPMLRYQFFVENWKNILKQLVDMELILADAAHIELKITDADIREKIHEQFGPNIMASLDAIGITLDEAWKMVKTDIAFERMVGYRVHSKAVEKVGPTEIKNAYVAYLEANPPKETWTYRVISIRAATEEVGKIYAQTTEKLLEEAFSPLGDTHNPDASLEAIVAKVRDDYEGATITLSQEYAVSDQHLNPEHKQILAHMKPQTCSSVINQLSRATGKTLHRIFYLKDHTKEKTPTFNELSEKLRNERLGFEVDKELKIYLSRLREKFHFVETSLPSDFQPFLLK